MDIRSHTPGDCHCNKKPIGAWRPGCPGRASAGATSNLQIAQKGAGRSGGPNATTRNCPTATMAKRHGKPPSGDGNPPED
eukprot:CAMPEP_0198495790 /NCGR_PEP_ID=MMETSP1462-20131121/5419_1 /TAXON_ID=1333877 /ORGANISM="Brandtodinium nutriculum, Strain RCC3387" /LENGTH=79 /DNA_ID=CAMNT_0044224587 /DNA_START=41 /DNA_END=277 /DNA_ORIENTATION=-